MLLDASEFWQTATTELSENIEQVGIDNPDFLQQTQAGARQLQSEVANKIQPEIVRLTQNPRPEINDIAIDLLIDFAENLIRLDRYDSDTAQVLETAINKANQLNNIEAEAKALGHLAYLYEQKKEYAKASQLTEKGLKLISTEQYPKIISNLNSQLGRILAIKGKKQPHFLLMKMHLQIFWLSRMSLRVKK